MEGYLVGDGSETFWTGSGVGPRKPHPLDGSDGVRPEGRSPTPGRIGSGRRTGSKSGRRGEPAAGGDRQTRSSPRLSRGGFGGGKEQGEVRKVFSSGCGGVSGVGCSGRGAPWIGQGKYKGDALLEGKVVTSVDEQSVGEFVPTPGRTTGGEGPPTPP